VSRFIDITLTPPSLYLKNWALGLDTKGLLVKPRLYRNHEVGQEAPASQVQEPYGQGRSRTL
jgi:hypothetical protein